MPKRSSSHQTSFILVLDLLSFMPNRTKRAAMKKPAATAHGALSVPVKPMIGSPMAKPKPSAIIIVVKKSELADKRSPGLTSLGIEDVSAGKKNCDAIEINIANRKANMCDCSVQGKAMRQTNAARAKLDTTITVLFGQRSTYTPANGLKITAG